MCEPGLAIMVQLPVRGLGEAFRCRVLPLPGGPALVEEAARRRVPL